MADQVSDDLFARRSAAARKAWETRRARQSARSTSVPDDPSRRELCRMAEAKARACITRARKHGLPFDAHWPESVAAQLQDQDYRCALSGLPFDLVYRTDGAGGRHFAPSPDRRVPARGYTASNVVWVLWAVNRAKGRMGLDDFLTVCEAIAAQREAEQAFD